MEERLSKEFDQVGSTSLHDCLLYSRIYLSEQVREVSLRLLFGSNEKAKRIGHGAMEEPIFTVAPFKVCLVHPTIRARVCRADCVCVSCRTTA